MALERAQLWMDEVQGVQAVGESEFEGRKCILVHIALPEAAAKLPSEFEGYKVVIEQGDPIHAQRNENQR